MHFETQYVQLLPVVVLAGKEIHLFYALESASESDFFPVVGDDPKDDDCMKNLYFVDRNDLSDPYRGTMGLSLPGYTCCRYEFHEE
jgi:hypothetical protein